MINIVNSVLLAYLAGTGTVANASIVTRGLLRAVQRAAQGDFSAAGVEALAAVSAPTLLAYCTTAAMVTEVFDGAYELLAPTLQQVGGPAQNRAA